MPPTTVNRIAADVNLDGDRKIGGLGSDVGPVKLEDDSVSDGSKVPMQDRWNSALYGPLEEQH